MNVSSSVALGLYPIFHVAVYRCFYGNLPTDIARDCSVNVQVLHGHAIKYYNIYVQL